MCVSAVQNQHEDLKKQYYELQDQHQAQGEDHNRLLGQHREHYEKLQQVKDGEISQLKGVEKKKIKLKNSNVYLSFTLWSHIFFVSTFYMEQ